MLGTLIKGTGRMVKAPAVLVSLVLTVITLIIAGVFAFTGQPDLAFCTIGTAMLLLSLLVVVLVQRNIMVFMRSMKQTDARIDNLERLVTRAEWRSGESSRQIETVVRRIDHSKRLEEIETTMVELHRQARSIASYITEGGSRNGPDERELEMLLVRAFVQTKRMN